MSYSFIAYSPFAMNLEQKGKKSKMKLEQSDDGKSDSFATISM